MEYPKGCMCSYLSDAQQKLTDLTLLFNAVQFFGGRGPEAGGAGDGLYKNYNDKYSGYSNIRFVRYSNCETLPN